MMHGRQLRPTDGINEGGYVVVSRAVGDPGVETEDYMLSEILLGVNVLRNTASSEPVSSNGSDAHVFTKPPHYASIETRSKGCTELCQGYSKLLRQCREQPSCCF